MKDKNYFTFKKGNTNTAPVVIDDMIVIPVDITAADLDGKELLMSLGEGNDRITFEIGRDYNE